MYALSHAARLYTLGELSRRAGVTHEVFSRWKIECSRSMLIVQPVPDSPAKIRFPVFPDKSGGAVRKSWTREVAAGLHELISDFVVPFCRRDSVAGEPLFREIAPDSFECTEDLLGSALLTLSRFEEIDSPEVDKHGRFPASASIALRHGFLNRPIVDEYGLALQQVLQILSPRWQPHQRPLRLKLSHDVDELGIPFSLRSPIGHMLKRGAPSACARDFLSVVGDIEPGYLNLVRTICQLSIDKGIRSAVYWQASSPSRFDTGYDLTHPKIARVIGWAIERGVEMGVHPGYSTFRSPARLADEVQRFRKAVHNSEIGGRQHYLRWSPETWADWEHCGLAYDSTVGFPDCVGFRAGTCVPYFPWLCKHDRMSAVFEIPLVVMDGTLVDYMKLSPEQSVDVVRNLVRRCAVVGGVFTLLWHNVSLLPPYKPFYPPILNILGGIKNYDWESDADEVLQFHRAGLVQRAGPECDVSIYRTPDLSISP